MELCRKQRGNGLCQGELIHDVLIRTSECFPFLHERLLHDGICVTEVYLYIWCDLECHKALCQADKASKPSREKGESINT